MGLAKQKCRCGSLQFEKVDITSAKDTQPRYFVRCAKCGFVAMVSDSASSAPVPAKSANIASRLIRFFKGNAV